jgi:hypothetical protein
MMQPLNEASLSRLWKHTQERNIGMVTAFRGRYTKGENLKRNSQLRNDIRAAGFGFYTVEGHYIEGYGSEKSKDVKEQTFLVIGDKGDDKGRLKGFLKKAGGKYNQDSVFYKSFNDKAMLIGTQSKDEEGHAVEFPGLNVEFSVGTFNPMKMGQFYSKMKGKPFVFESYEEAETFMTKWIRHIMEKRQADPTEE